MIYIYALRGASAERQNPTTNPTLVVIPPKTCNTGRLPKQQSAQKITLPYFTLLYFNWLYVLREGAPCMLTKPESRFNMYRAVFYLILLYLN